MDVHVVDDDVNVVKAVVTGERAGGTPVVLVVGVEPNVAASAAASPPLRHGLPSTVAVVASIERIERDTWLRLVDIVPIAVDSVVELGPPWLVPFFVSPPGLVVVGGVEPVVGVQSRPIWPFVRPP